jgi:selenocysteine lyase/cysteine desulfurase
VRRSRIARLWPLMAAEKSQDDNIRKFEEIGTHPAANHNAIAEALTFTEGIGIERKSARLRYLKDRWATRLRTNPRVSMLTPLDPSQSCGIATFNIEGIDPVKLVAHLWNRYRIIATPIDYANCKGIRVTPSVYSTLGEVDTFCDAVEDVIRKGLPSA